MLSSEERFLNIVGVQDGFKMESGTAPGVSHEGLMDASIGCWLVQLFYTGINKIFFNFIKYLLYC